MNWISILLRPEGAALLTVTLTRKETGVEPLKRILGGLTDRVTPLIVVVAVMPTSNEQASEWLVAVRLNT